MYDAIVVGARCAGAATALLLARKGHKVLLVDRASFPSDTISGHFILQRGTSRLKSWGLLDKVFASNCPPITRMSANFGEIAFEGQLPTFDDLPPAAGPRRTVLDKVLVDAAVEAGVELREQFIVTDLLTDGDKVVGIQGHSTKITTPVAENAKLVIGADGKHSKIAELVHAPMYRHVPSLTCWYYTYWSDFPCEMLELNARPQQVSFTFPTNDGLTFTALALPHDRLHEIRSDIEGNYRRALDPTGIGERLRNARIADRFYGMADVPNFLRKPHGEGWALVGDAGHHKDPYPAYGISDAFCDAELLTDAIHKGLSGEQSMVDALAHYEQTRDARAIPEHDSAVESARLTPPAIEQIELMKALVDNPEATTQFFGVVNGVVNPGEFFAPPNLLKIIGARGMAKIMLNKVFHLPQKRAS